MSTPGRTVVRTIRCPNGHSVTLGAYVIAWRQLREVAPDVQIRDWSHFPTEARQVLAQMREGMHDRINVRLAWWGRGRKWGSQWQRDIGHLARRVNGRCVVRPSEVPQEFRGRLEQTDRLTQAWEE